MEGLPRSHARLLKARVHTLRSTLRHKKSLEGEVGDEGRGDVRGIFGDRDGLETTNHVAGGRNATNHTTVYLVPATTDGGSSTSVSVFRRHTYTSQSHLYMYMYMFFFT